MLTFKFKVAITFEELIRWKEHSSPAISPEKEPTVSLYAWLPRTAVLWSRGEGRRAASVLQLASQPNKVLLVQLSFP